MASTDIIIKGARVHNLKNVSLTIPRDQFIVFTGLSGSGKSSLAFDTLYAEGQRRFVESLSSYARLFLGQLDKPDVDSIEGLSPAISIDQKTTSKNPRSTVGTVTEIYDYLRLLYARMRAVPHCPRCGETDPAADGRFELVDRSSWPCRERTSASCSSRRSWSVRRRGRTRSSSRTRRKERRCPRPRGRGRPHPCPKTSSLR